MGTNRLERTPAQQPLARFAALGLAAAGAMYYNLLPLTLGLLQEEHGFSNTKLGLLSAAFFLGFNLLSGTSFFWLRRFRWPVVAFLASAASMAAIAAMAIAGSFATLTAISVIAGGAFSALYAMSAAIIAEQNNQTRWFGLKLSMEGLSGAFLFIVLPGTLIASMGFNGMLLGMALVLLLLCPLWLWLPRNNTVPTELAASSAKKSTDHKDSATHTGWLAVWLAIAGVLIFFAGQTTIWAFIERLGTTAGYTSDAITNLLSVTLLFAVAGSMTAAVLGTRYGNRTPFYLCCLLFFCAAFGLNYPHSFPVYAFGTCAATYSVAAGLAFGISEIATQDLTGRFIILSVPAVGVGAMIGPGLAGFLADAYGYGAVLLFGVCSVALGGLFVMGIGWIDRMDGNQAS